MDLHTRVVSNAGLLNQAVCAADRLAEGVPSEKQTLVRSHQLIKRALSRFQTPKQKEWLRFALVPSFERKAIAMYHPGDHVLAGFGYVNRLLDRARDAGGKVILEARNSHPSNFWSINAEECARWDCDLVPIDTAHHMRQQRSVALADYVIAPSRFVRDSFFERGFPDENLIRVPYPVDFELFKPNGTQRPANRPFTLISTGLICLRKGYPYLFEALKLLRAEIADIRLVMIRNIGDDMMPLMKSRGYDKLPIEWREPMGHRDLARLMQDADIYVLPTLEEGMVRTVAEALATGLPVVTTPHAGADDWIVEGENGSVVHIRDVPSLVSAVLRWHEVVMAPDYVASRHQLVQQNLSFEAFEARLMDEFRRVGLIETNC